LTIFDCSIDMSPLTVKKIRIEKSAVHRGGDSALLRNLHCMFIACVSCVVFTLTPTAGSYAADGTKSVWQGVYTKEQAARGKARYFTACASCHGGVLQGDGDVPELAGKSFLKRWSDQSIGALFAFSSSQMPVGRPGSLGSQGYADVIAYILAVNSFPDGQQELPGGSSVLDGIMIEKAK
jgi:mono/diheme cytochrome c family protein